jgi:hypothetical protein
VEFLMTAVLENSGTLAQGRETIGLAAGALAAMLAANTGWKVTDWVLARRQSRQSGESAP